MPLLGEFDLVGPALDPESFSVGRSLICLRTGIIFCGIIWPVVESASFSVDHCVVIIVVKLRIKKDGGRKTGPNGHAVSQTISWPKMIPVLRQVKFVDRKWYRFQNSPMTVSNYTMRFLRQFDLIGAVLKTAPFFWLLIDLSWHRHHFICANLTCLRKGIIFYRLIWAVIEPASFFVG